MFYSAKRQLKTQLQFCNSNVSAMLFEVTEPGNATVFDVICAWVVCFEIHIVVRFGMHLYVYIIYTTAD